MTNQPTVSIIIPSYNHRKYVGLLVDSIYKQSFQNFELIVLDDGSSDGSVELLKALSREKGFTLIVKENEGLCKTINRGLALVRGKFVMIIGSDDIIPHKRLEEQVSFLESHPDIDVVAGCVIQIDLEGKERGLNTPKILGNVTLRQQLRINRIFAPTAMIRSSVFSRWGIYKEDHVFEDYYMWLNILFHGGKIYNTNNIWAYYRIANPDLEKKFNWYFRGVIQALKEFGNDPRALKAMRRYTLIYSVKMSLLLGRSFMQSYQNVYGKLGLFGKFLTRIITITPNFIRGKILKVLKLKS